MNSGLIQPYDNSNVLSLSPNMNESLIDTSHINKNDYEQSFENLNPRDPTIKDNDILIKVSAQHTRNSSFGKPENQTENKFYRNFSWNKTQIDFSRHSKSNIPKYRQVMDYRQRKGSSHESPNSYVQETKLNNRTPSTCFSDTYTSGFYSKFSKITKIADLIASKHRKQMPQVILIDIYISSKWTQMHRLQISSMLRPKWVVIITQKMSLCTRGRSTATREVSLADPKPIVSCISKREWTIKPSNLNTDIGIGDTTTNSPNKMKAQLQKTQNAEMQFGDVWNQIVKKLIPTRNHKLWGNAPKSMDLKAKNIFRRILNQEVDSANLSKGNQFNKWDDLYSRILKHQ